MAIDKLKESEEGVHALESMLMIPKDKQISLFNLQDIITAIAEKKGTAELQRLAETIENERIASKLTAEYRKNLPKGDNINICMGSVSKTLKNNELTGNMLGMNIRTLGRVWNIQEESFRSLITVLNSNMPRDAKQAVLCAIAQGIASPPDTLLQEVLTLSRDTSLDESKNTAIRSLAERVLGKSREISFLKDFIQLAQSQDPEVKQRAFDGISSLIHAIPSNTEMMAGQKSVTDTVLNSARELSRSSPQSSADRASVKVLREHLESMFKTDGDFKLNDDLELARTKMNGARQQCNMSLELIYKVLIKTKDPNLENVCWLALLHWFSGYSDERSAILSKVWDLVSSRDQNMQQAAIAMTGLYGDLCHLNNLKQFLYENNPNYELAATSVRIILCCPNARADELRKNIESVSSVTQHLQKVFQTSGRDVGNEKQSGIFATDKNGTL